MREIIADSRMMHIGKNGEGDALRVTFPVVSEWEALYGAGGVWTLNVQRNGDALAYAAQDFKIEDGATIWVVTDADAAVVGEGRCELTYKIGDTVAKSRTYAFRVDRSLTGGGDVPDPVKGWQEALEERVDGKLDRPDGGSAGDVLTKTGDGEEWKPAAAEQEQADWNQNDRTAKDYIKNRPFYTYGESEIESEDLISHGNGEIVKIQDTENEIWPNMKVWVKYWGTPPWFGYNHDLILKVKLTDNRVTNYKENACKYDDPQSWETIGKGNCKISDGKQKLTFYIITDTSTLEGNNSAKFSEAGMYCSYDKTKDSAASNLKALSYIVRVTYSHKLDTAYIDDNVERSVYKVSDMSLWQGREDFYPSVAAVEKYVGEEIDANPGENVVYVEKTGTSTYAVKRNASDETPMPFAELLAMAKAPSTTVAVFDRYRLPLAALTDTGMIFESVYSATVFTVQVMKDNSAYQQSVTVMNAPLTDALKIPAWALSENKPTYTASEVGAVASQQAVSDAGKVLTVGDDGTVAPKEAAGGSDLSLGLTSAQVGQIIKVKAVDDAGRPTQWEAGDLTGGLPNVTENNNGQFLRVVNGAWAADTVPSAGGASF